jgi:hypothetical protein
MTRLAGLVAIAVSLTACNNEDDLKTPPEATDLVPRIVGAPRESAAIFISGHSLTDNPFPDYLAEIARSLGTPAHWNHQNIVGSSIRRRTRGEQPEDTGWQGYSQGKNREAQGLNVVDELRKPQTLGGQAYDVLIITEQHGLLGSMLWNDTVGYLRHFHDRFIEGNPDGTTYFYASWLDVNDKADPRRWIAYEEAASTVWQCVATRINESLALEGRSDRIESLPTARALATLVKTATEGADLPGVSGSSVRQTMDRLFQDRVHLTRLGVYYVALITYATVFRRSPIGAWAPADVTPQQAAVLQQVAWNFVQNYLERNRPPTLDACRTFVRDDFVHTYWRYVRDTYWNDEGSARAYVRWLKHLVIWRYRFWRDDAANPLYLDPTSDADRWYPPP